MSDAKIDPWMEAAAEEIALERHRVSASNECGGSYRMHSPKQIIARHAAPVLAAKDKRIAELNEALTRDIPAELLDQQQADREAIAEKDAEIERLTQRILDDALDCGRELNSKIVEIATLKAEVERQAEYILQLETHVEVFQKEAHDE
jgi:hypothetical protein